MKKRLVIVIILAIITLVVIYLISYIITRNNQVSMNVNTDTLNNADQTSANTNQLETDSSTYKDINIDSELAKEIFDFVPKYLQNVTDKMSNEYKLYAAIARLDEKNIPAEACDINGEIFDGYKSDLINKTEKEIFGSNAQVEKKDKYNLPLGYSTKDDMFCKYPTSYGSAEEHQVIKSLQENDKTYKLTIYALNIEYDINDTNHIYIETKDTFKLHQNSEASEDDIRASMKQYTLNGIDIDSTVIANEFKDYLPVIEYDLEKLDSDGTKYYVKNIKYILD